MSKYIKLIRLGKYGRALGLAAALFLCSGCGTAPSESGSEIGTTESGTEAWTETGTGDGTEGTTGGRKENELPAGNKILLVFRSTNGAWNYQDEGQFYTSLGQVYSFNFNQMHFPGMDGLPFWEKLALIRDRY